MFRARIAPDEAEDAGGLDARQGRQRSMAQFLPEQIKGFYGSSVLRSRIKYCGARVSGGDLCRRQKRRPRRQPRPANEQHSESSYGGCEQRSDLCIMYRAVGRNLPPPCFYHNMMHPVMFCFGRGSLHFTCNYLPLSAKQMTNDI